MIENLLGSLLGHKYKDDCDVCEKESNGWGKYIPLILVGFVLLGGLKLFEKPEDKN